MLISTRNIDYDIVTKCVGRPDSLVTYANSLVPIWAHHVNGLVDNQRYYLALHVRKLLNIPYKRRKELYEALVNGISLTGVMTQFITLDELFSFCNMSDLIHVLRKDIADGR